MSPTFPEVLRRDLLTFAKQVHFELYQSLLSDDPYLALLARDVELIVRGNIGRYVCNLPPGHGKTFHIFHDVTSVAFGSRTVCADPHCVIWGRFGD